MKGRALAAAWVMTVAAPSSALACVCGPDSGVVPIVAGNGPTPLSTNGVFRLREITPGELAAEDWVVVDAEGVVVPTRADRFPEPDDSTWIELAPVEPLIEGESYFLQPRAWDVGYPYVVEGPEDRVPPELLDVRITGTQHFDDTSCGEAHLAFLEFDIDPDADELSYGTRIFDLDSGLYWHGSISWNPTCGGYPLELWRGRKSITVVDAAGNESEPVLIGGPSPGCGCAQGASAGPASFLLPWLLLGLAGRRRPGVAGRAWPC